MRYFVIICHNLNRLTKFLYLYMIGINGIIKSCGYQKELDLLILVRILEGENMYLESFLEMFNPKNWHNINVQRKLFRELRRNKIKFDSWSIFSCKTFKETEKKAVPILIKYIEQFDSEGEQLHYINALGVKGFDDATEYLIAKYKKYLHPYNQTYLNVISQTLANICDLRYLDTYFEFLSNDVTIDACYLVQMLGNLKVEKAIPYLIKLVDCVAIIPEKWVGTVAEEQKFYVSQCAIKALGRFKRKELNQYIEKFLNPSAIEWIKYTEPNVDANILKFTYKEYIKVATKAMC